MSDVSMLPTTSSPAVPPTQPALPIDDRVMPVQPVVPVAPVADTAALATPVIGQVANTQVPQGGGSARSKEMGGAATQEAVPFVEVVGTDAIETEPIPPEVEKWMEKVNKGEDTGGLQEVVVADKNQSAPTGNYARTPVFVLPLGDEELKRASHASVNNSIRWLATWCKRMIKKLGPQVALEKTT